MKKLVISSVALFFMAVAPSFAAPRPAVPYRSSAAAAASAAKKAKKQSVKKNTKTTKKSSKKKS
jgi:hypothetical protein